jgi:hypothetical protein
VQVDWPKVADTFESFVTALALIIAGAWTWLVFVRQRLGKPKLATSIQPYVVRCDDGWIVHVAVSLSNNGSVLARLCSAELRLRQLIPLPQEVSDLARGGADIVYKGETSVAWPMLASREWAWNKGQCEIEPSETDMISADFFVPSEVSTLQLYLYVENAAKKRQAIGWSSTLIYQLPKSGEESMADNKKERTTRVGQRQPEKKQQPQQQQQQQQQSQQEKPPQTEKK